MNCNLKFWILLLGFLTLTLSTLFGGDIIYIWTGGEGGMTNLPSAACSSCSSQDRMNQIATGKIGEYRYCFKMRNVEEGIGMALPPNMPEAIAIYIQGAVVTTTMTARGFIQLAGQDLIDLREAGILDFHILLTGADELQMFLTVKMQPDAQEFEVLVD